MSRILVAIQGALVAAAPVAIPLAIGMGLLALAKGSSTDTESGDSKLDGDNK